MKWVKVLALVLGSPWFFPVSCTSTFYAGMDLLSRLHPLPFFLVVVEPGENGQPFQLVIVKSGENGKPLRSVSFFDLPEFRDTGRDSGGASLLMSKPLGRIDVNDYTYLSYRVREDQGSAQVIEVEQKDDNKTLWSRYRATRTEVTPLASRMPLHFGYMFSVLPLAFVTACVLYGIGQFLRRRLRVAGTAANAS